MRLAPVLALALVLLAGCKAEDPKPPPPDGVNCTSACVRLRDLGCVSTTPAGAACEEWLCRSLPRVEGTTCMVHATSCGEAMACR